MCPICSDRGCPTCSSPPPPGHTYGTWAVLVRRCRQLDDRFNHGAGKPRLTSGNSSEHVCDSGTLAGNETGPGAVDAASRPLAAGPVEETR